MVGRVTERTFLPRLLTNLNNTRNRINKFQMQISTSHKINKASDDPFNIENVIKFKTELSKNDQYQTTLRESTEFLTTTTLAIDNMVATLRSAKEKAIQGVDDINRNDLAAYQQAFEGFLQELLQQSHVKYRNQYIFGGTNGNQVPFELNGAGTAVMTNTNGVDGIVRREVSENRVEQINVRGDQLFNRNVDIFQTIITIRDAFASGNQAAVRAQFDNLDASIDQMLHYATDAGKKINRFEVLAARFKFEATQTKSDLSQIQDINVAETVTMLKSEETALNAALQVIGRLSNPTLLNYVR